MRIDGQIIRHNEKQRALYVLANNIAYRIQLNNSTSKKFGMYFNPNVYISCIISDEPFEKRGTSYHRFTKMLKLTYIKKNSKKIYYDFNEIQDGIKQVLSEKENRMFVDLELSMHPYYKTENYVQEIIQCGFILEDDEGNEIKRESYFIKPLRFPQLTKRTLKFLTISQNDVDNGLNPRDFYHILKDIMDEYHPKLIVWGRNDFLAIDSFYEISHLEPITVRGDFVNLSQLYKTYHSLKDDMGLFKCYESYDNEIDQQEHDALEDARVTREIYHLFKQEVEKADQE